MLDFGDRDRPTDVAGVYFEIEELQVLLGLAVRGFRVEVTATSALYEEVVVFRRDGSPAVVLATLHKSPDGFLILTRQDPDNPFGAPSSRDAFQDLETAVPTLRRLLARQPSRGAQR